MRPPAVILTVFAWLALSAAAGEDNPAPPAEDRIDPTEAVIILGGEPTPGWPVLPASETEYRFKLKLTGDIVALRWLDLDDYERARVQKLYGIETRGAQRVFGEKITGTRYLLKNGKRIAGYRLPERDWAAQKALKTATAPVLYIPESDIETEETFEAYQSDFFSPMEVYQQWLLAKPPGPNDAAAHFAMAQKVSNIGLFDKAIDHLKMATVIDPGMEERNKDFFATLVQEDAKRRTLDLYQRMLLAKNSGDFGSAFDFLGQLDRNFPNSDFKTRWDGDVRREIEVGMKTATIKRVIQMSYSVAADLVQQRLFSKVRVDDKGNVIPSIPGKQVATRAGHILRGTLEIADDGSSAGTGAAGTDLVLRIGEVKVTISGRDIVSIRDVDLATSGKEIPRAFDDLKDYVTDTGRPDGLKAQMIARIAQTLREPETKVKEIFNSRLAREATYKDGVYKVSPTYVTLHDAWYGSGSWLRDGSRPGNQKRAGHVADTTDDPNVWWRFQSTETQLAVLRSMAAEKVFKRKDLYKLPCPNCAGHGYLRAGLERIRCPLCRGIGVLFKMTYQ
jgi:hypothetical protein